MSEQAEERWERDDDVAGDVHSTISPHDVPKDSPNRREVEEKTEEEGGEATRGNA
jgi:hypothetical protein